MKKAELLEHRAHAERGLGRLDAVEADLKSALVLHERHGSPEGAARVTAELTNQLIWQGRSQDAERLAERGLAATEGRDSTERCRLLSSLALGQCIDGKVEQAERGFVEAVAMARRLGDARLLADAPRAAPRMGESGEVR